MNKVPVTILGGFLGAGKTTLLNRILTAEHGMRVAVLVNDFGEINIDSQLISNVEGEKISLANGCVCCTIRDDLVSAVEQLLDAPEPPEYIVTETSGISDPKAVAMGFAFSSRLALRVAVDAIVTLVDAENIETLDANSKNLAIDQITAADIVVLNKIDLVSSEQLMALHRWVDEVAPAARVYEAQQAEVPLPLILGIAAFGALAVNQSSGHTHEHSHAQDFSAWSWREPEPLAFEAIYNALKTLPRTVFRVKGILSLREVPDRRVIVQMVGDRVSVTRGEPWADATRDSQLVAIGPAQGALADELASRFAACRASLNPPGENPMADAVIHMLRRPE